jgi:hypothetical protein
MLIRVVYQDFTYDLVKPFRLDEFLKSGKVAMFRRRSGWVFVGIDPIRKSRNSSSLQMKDRRRSME